MISIRAVAINKNLTSNWIDLPETSKWLSDKQILPIAGDAIGLVGNDGSLAGADPNNLATNILTVKRRWIRHSIADVVVALEYEVW